MALDISSGPQAWADTYWTVSSGAVTNFSANGATGENVRYYTDDPWGRSNIAWSCQPDGTASGGDGGWNTSNIAISPSNMYRYSVWIRLITTGTGTCYFGTQSSGGLLDLDGTEGALYNNPYFLYFPVSRLNTYGGVGTWLLLCGFVWPYGTDLAVEYHHPDFGAWKRDGTYVDFNYSPGAENDYAWKVGSSNTYHRSYLYYANTDTDARIEYMFPRIDLIDGTEPTKQDLLRHGRSYLLGNILVN